MKRKVLFLRSNPVDPDSRVEKEVFSLVEGGYNVEILCWDRKSNHKISRESKSIMGVEIPIYRIGEKAAFGAGMKSLIPFLKFQYRMKKWIKKNIEKYDIIHACDFDTAFFTYHYVLKKKKILIFDVFDFICGNPKNFLQRRIKKAQIRIINSANGTIICTEERKKQICDSKPKNLEIIHNSPMKKTLEAYKPVIKSNSERVKYVYVGILQDYRFLTEIGEYFKTHNDVELHIGGFGKYENFFNNLSLECENVNYYGKLSYEDTVSLEKDCDVMLALYDPSIENHVFAAPNKFYEGLFLKKPLIMAKGTGLSSIVSKYNYGFVCDYSNEGLNDAIEYTKENIDSFKKNANEIYNVYINNYDWDIMKIRLIKFYDKISFEEK